MYMTYNYNYAEQGNDLLITYKESENFRKEKKIERKIERGIQIHTDEMQVHCYFFYK